MGNSPPPVFPPVIPPVIPIVEVVTDVLVPEEDPIETVVDAFVPSPPAPEPCEGAWSDYGTCSALCGRNTTKEPKHGGTACPSPTTETQTCNTQACPINCQGYWDNNGDYSPCSAPCGGGTQTRTWTTTAPEAYGGEPCPGTETRECNTQPCPEPCEGAWSDYGTCSASCGGGTQTRTWTTTKEPKHGGTACPSPTTETQTCNTQACDTSSEVTSESDDNTENAPPAGDVPQKKDSSDNTALAIMSSSASSLCCVIVILILIS
jgi:hypothetical protein